MWPLSSSRAWYFLDMFQSQMRLWHQPKSPALQLQLVGKLSCRRKNLYSDVLLPALEEQFDEKTHQAPQFLPSDMQLWIHMIIVIKRISLATSHHLFTFLSSWHASTGTKFIRMQIEYNEFSFKKKKIICRRFEPWVSLFKTLDNVIELQYYWQFSIWKQIKQEVMSKW